MSVAADAFALHRLTPVEWIIVDVSLSERDPRRTVACVCEVDLLRYDVVWLRNLGLPATYTSPHDVLTAVISRDATRRRSERPVPVPRLPRPGERISA